MSINIPSEALMLREKLVQYRHNLHSIPELDLYLPATSDYVKKKLNEIGIAPSPVGEYGLTFTLGAVASGKTIMLRADMDGLPITEETGLPYSSHNGNMHACGHDMHTAMLLGAAELLKKHEHELKGSVKFLFQPGEETMRGALDAIANGILEDPHVDSAMMMHVMTGIPLPTGTFVSSSTEGVISASSDWFEIIIRGNGTHGAIASSADPLETIARLYFALKEITKDAASHGDAAVVSIGVLQGGSANNVIPDTAVIKGSVRTFSVAMRDNVESRIRETVARISSECGTKAEIIYTRGCPPAVTDHDLNQQMIRTVTDCYGSSSLMDIGDIAPGGRLPGSEDFAFITHEVPSTVVFLAAGCTNDGFVHPVHNPKTAFSDDVLHKGAAIYSAFAIDWLNSQTIS